MLWFILCTLPRWAIKGVCVWGLAIWVGFIGLAYQDKDVVFRFIIEYSSLRGFGP
jgi:hypothetical protein